MLYLFHIILKKLKYFFVNVSKFLRNFRRTALDGLFSPVIRRKISNKLRASEIHRNFVSQRSSTNRHVHRNSLSGFACFLVVGVVPSNYDANISGTAMKIYATAQIPIIGDIDRGHRNDSDDGKNVAGRTFMLVKF